MKTPDHDANGQETNAEHDSDGNLGANSELKIPQNRERQSNDGDINDHVDGHGCDLVEVNVTTVAMRSGMPLLRGRNAAGHEEDEESNSVRGDYTNEGVGPALEGLNAEDTCVKPKHGELDEDGSQKPSGVGSEDKLIVSKSKFCGSIRRNA